MAVYSIQVSHLEESYQSVLSTASANPGVSTTVNLNLIPFSSISTVLVSIWTVWWIRSANPNNKTIIFHTLIILPKIYNNIYKEVYILSWGEGELIYLISQRRSSHTLVQLTSLSISWRPPSFPSPPLWIFQSHSSLPSKENQTI